MTFIPREPEIGDYVSINEPIANAEGTFTTGTEFEIIDVRVRHGRTFYDLRDHDQRLLFDVPLELVRLSRAV